MMISRSSAGHRHLSSILLVKVLLMNKAISIMPAAILSSIFGTGRIAALLHEVSLDRWIIIAGYF